MMKIYDYKTASFERTFDCYDHVDCYNYMDLHDLLKLYKHGYSKVTDHACREIRFGRLEKIQANIIVNYYQQRNIKYENLFTEWLGIPIDSLLFMMNQFRNKVFWEEYSIGKWQFNNFHIEKSIKKNKPILKDNSVFISTNDLDLDKKKGYIIYGKGFP